jgi:hypothetical protein
MRSHKGAQVARQHFPSQCVLAEARDRRAAIFHAIDAKEGLMQPPPSSSSAMGALGPRLPLLFAERPGYSAAGDPVLYAGVLACGRRFAVVPKAGTVLHRMHSFRCAPGSRPIHFPTVPRPNAAQTDAVMRHTSCQAPVHPGSHTIRQPLARARQPRHDCAKRNLDYVRNLLVRHFFQLPQDHYLPIVNWKSLETFM